MAACRPTSNSIARRRAASASLPPRSTTRSTTRSASGSCRRSSRSRISIASCSRSSRTFSVVLPRSPTSTSHRRSPGQAPQQVPLSSIATVVERPASLSVNHIGQFPAATISFNLAPGASLGDAVKAIETVESGARHPAQRADQLPGGGARLPRVARQRAVADPGRDRHDVHRAGRALRELHPSDHDPLDAAVGRRGRAAGADALRATISRSSRSSASSC